MTRDEHGRIGGYGELLAALLPAFLLNAGLVLAIDLAAVLFGSDFGRTSGWMAILLPAWLFAEEFRAWRAVHGRIGVALFAAVFALIAGLLIAGAVAGVLPILSGGCGAAVAVLVYATLWFFGIRWLAGRTGEGEK